MTTTIDKILNLPELASKFKIIAMELFLESPVFTTSDSELVITFDKSKKDDPEALLSFISAVFNVAVLDLGEIKFFEFEREIAPEKPKKPSGWRWPRFGSFTESEKGVAPKKEIHSVNNPIIWDQKPEKIRLFAKNEEDFKNFEKMKGKEVGLRFVSGNNSPQCFNVFISKIAITKIVFH